MSMTDVETDIVLTGLDGSDPLGWLAAIGTLRIVANAVPTARLRWALRERWIPVLSDLGDLDLVEELMRDLEWWREAPPPAIAFAIDADRKIQDLKHPPPEYREWMRQAMRSGDREWADHAMAYATGIVVDGSGQTKPTSFHFTAGTQRFMSVPVELLETVIEDDLRHALFGPWAERDKAKTFRWRAGGERSRALLSFDPSKRSASGAPGPNWLAFHALPLFPAVAIGGRVRTACFTGRGRSESFAWPLWELDLRLDEAKGLVTFDWVASDESNRHKRGVVAVFRSSIVRSNQGYGSFSPASVV
ncbi:MAG: hypothetical protein AAF715_25610 [Myxococcota bacterium]